LAGRNEIDLILGLKLSEFFNSNKKAWVEFSKTKSNIEKNPVNFRSTGTANILKRISQIGLAYIGIRKIVDDLSTSETNLANVASLGVDNIKELGEGVQKIGLNVAVPLHDIEAGLYEVVSAGVDANQQINVLESSARAAKAGLAETTDALNLGSAVIKGYGLDWSEFESIMDQAFQTVKLGQTTFPRLAKDMGRVIPFASALKIKTSELFGVFATLTGVTGNASEVATQFRGILAGIAQPTKELAQLMKSLGYESASAAVEQNGLGGFLKIVANATGGSADKMSQYFGSIEAVNGALALSGKQFDTFLDKSAQVGESAAVMSEAYKIQAETGKSAMTRFDNSVQVLSQRLTKSLVPAVTDVINIGADLLGWFANLDEGTQKTALAISGFILIGSRVPSMLVAIRTAIIALNASLGPVGWLVLGIGAAATAWSVNAASTEKANEKLKEYKKTAESFNTDQLTEEIKTVNDELKRTKDLIKKEADEEPDIFDILVAGAKSVIGGFSAVTFPIEVYLNQLDQLTKKEKTLNEILKERDIIKKGGISKEEPKIAQQGERFQVFTPEDVQRLEVLRDEIRVKFYEPLHQMNTEFSGLNFADLNFEYSSRVGLLENYMENVRSTLGEESELYKDLAFDKLVMERNYHNQKKTLEELGAKHALEMGSQLMGVFQGQNKTLFEIGKKLAIANLIITQGEAIGRAYKDYPWPFNIAVAAIQAALVAGQIAAVTKAEFKVSGKALGGLIRPEDIFSYRYVPDNEDGLIAAQIGEMVMNRSATKKYFPVLNKMNEQGRKGFAEGGIVTPGDISTNSGGISDEFFNRIHDAIITGISKSSLTIHGEFTQRGRDLKLVIEKNQELEQRL